MQQFILYATSPKLKAVEVRETAGEEHGAFTAALLAGLRGAGAAKAWSWERNRYEVRWERLADYVKTRIQDEARKVADTPDGALLQIPQDTGSRGVAGRPRDVVVTSFATDAFPKERLEVLLDPDTAYATADVRVLDAARRRRGRPGGRDGQLRRLLPAAEDVRAARRRAEARAGPGRVPRRAVRAAGRADDDLAAADRGAGGRSARRGCAGSTGRARPRRAARAEPPTPAEAPASTRGAEAVAAPGRIPLEASDPLSLVEVADETGNVFEVVRAGAGLELPPGFYRIRHVGPERTIAYDPVALASAETEVPLRLAGTVPSPATAALAKAMGGRVGKAHTVELKGREPAAWAQTSTLVAMALGAALQGEKGRAALDLRARRAFGRRRARSGLAVYVVSEEGELDPGTIELRVWAAGEVVPRKTVSLRRADPRLGELVLPHEPGPCWVSLLRRGEGRPIVFAGHVLRDRLATLVVQITKGIRLFQYMPLVGEGDSTTPETLRRVEYLERMLLAGRLDGAYELVRELEAVVEDDPFVGCLCGYVLLRLGRLDELAKLAETVIRTAPQLADGFILQGECAAAAGASAAKQSFAEAVAAGVPLFAEGLTRLLEGARVHDIRHPRTAIVRYLFQNHMRGSMWAVCTPAKLEPGRLLVTAASLGYEA